MPIHEVRNPDPEPGPTQEVLTDMEYRAAITSRARQIIKEMTMPRSDYDRAYREAKRIIEYAIRASDAKAATLEGTYYFPTFEGAQEYVDAWGMRSVTLDSQPRGYAIQRDTHSVAYWGPDGWKELS